MEIHWDYNITLPVFKEVYTTNADIILLWGGRYSGKSRNIPHPIINDILANPKSKVILIRNVFDTIKESIFAEFDQFLENNGFYEAGLFKKTKSPLEINCINGSKIITRGCDNPNKIKSVREPDTVVIEEADQITEEAFDYILTTVRSSTKKCKIYLLFNPEFTKSGNWIKDRFFNDAILNGQDMYGRVYYERTTQIKGKDVTLKTLALHSTLDDNPFCPADKEAMLNEYKEINLNKYNVWRFGLWGKAEIQRPYVNTFKQDKHMGVFEFDRSDILLSFDFNVDPIVCVASQLQKGKITFIDEYRLRDSDIYALCEYIKPRLPKANYLWVTGDATGKNRSAMTQGGLNYYHVIQEKLNIADNAFIIPAKNQSTQNGREMMNRAFYLNKCFINESMTYLTNDLIYCEADMWGDLVKKTSGKGKELSHLLDAFKYSLVNFYNKELQL